jgi:hypothetical protein
MPKRESKTSHLVVSQLRVGTFGDVEIQLHLSRQHGCECLSEYRLHRGAKAVAACDCTLGWMGVGLTPNVPHRRKGSQNEMPSNEDKRPTHLPQEAPRPQP